MMITLFYDKNDAKGGSRIYENSSRKVDNIQVDINIIELILDISK